MIVIYRIVFFLCIVGTIAALPNFPSTKIRYVVSGDTLTQPYYRNIPLSSTSEDIKYAIISLHGDGRNADEHFNIIEQATVNAGLEDSTILLAPIYPFQDDINQYNLGDDVLYWSDTDWNAGDLSRNTQSNPRPFRISSFSTMDTIYHRLVENNPNLKRIVLTGHSAGSQMVVRYAAGGKAQIALDEVEIDFVYVPTNTPSFLYYDDNRVVNENAEVFEFGPTDCGSASQYKYGLDNLNQYMTTTGETTIIENYELASVTYLIGQYDFGGQTSTCARMVQGSSRLIRTHVYFSYIGFFYGDSVYNNHRMAEIPSAYHEFDQIIFTDCGMNALFNIGDCDLYADGTQLFNYKPVAAAGEDQVVNPGNTAVLDASGSYDQDGEIETYSWTQVSGDMINIEFSGNVVAQFTMPEQGGGVDIELTVLDNNGASDSDTIRVVINQPPTAEAGEDQEAGYSAVVLLDGSQSSDTNGEIERFLWEQLSGEPVSVFSSDQPVATFYSPSADATLSFVLSVFDEQGLSDKDTTDVFVSSLSINSSKEEKSKTKMSVFPNPFNSTLLIDYVNQNNLMVDNIVVYNIVGEKIISWDVSGNTDTKHYFYWDGKDVRGFEIRSGLYFVRFEGKINSIIKKVTYLK